MLNELEKRILRYMIAQNTDRCISIPFEDVELRHRIETIKSLERQGYVIAACTLISASAFLTAKGKYAFNEENEMLYGAYSDKITQLENYIDEGEQIMRLQDNDKALSFIYTILDVFCDQFDKTVSQGIRIRLGICNEGNVVGFYCEDELPTIIAKLKSILAETKIEASKQSSTSIQNNFNPVINQTTTVDININNVIEAMTKTNMSAEDQVALFKLLKEIEDNKRKPKLWEKITNALKYVIEKGIEVASIAIPFITQYVK